MTANKHAIVSKLKTYFGYLRSFEVYYLPKLFGMKDGLHSLLQCKAKFSAAAIIIMIIIKILETCNTFSKSSCF